MQDVAARAHVVLDYIGEDGVGNEGPQHRGWQVSREDVEPDEDDWDGHEGGGGQSTDDVDVAGGGIQDAVEQAQPFADEGGLPAEQHLVRALQRLHGIASVPCAEQGPQRPEGTGGPRRTGIDRTIWFGAMPTGDSTPGATLFTGTTRCS